jgi:hypothetical protein
VLFLAAWGCGSSDPGTFDLELSASSLDVPFDNTGGVLVQIRCGTNTKRFIVQITVEGAPAGLAIQVPAPGTVNCKNGDPVPSPMSVTPDGVAVGTYDVVVVGINYNESDVMLVEPGVVREVAFTVNVTP